MTCIAAWIDRKAKQVHMAADTQASDAFGTTMAVSKLRTMDGVVVGVAGMSATLPLLRLAGINKPAPRADWDLWAQEIAERITALQFERGCVEANDEHSTYGVILLAYRDRLWEVTTHVALPVLRDYHAIGSGDMAAMGAMWATCRGSLATPTMVAAAVEAAAEHHQLVGGLIETAHT